MHDAYTDNRSYYTKTIKQVLEGAWNIIGNRLRIKSTVSSIIPQLNNSRTRMYIFVAMHNKSRGNAM